MNRRSLARRWWVVLALGLAAAPLFGGDFRLQRQLASQFVARKQAEAAQLGPTLAERLNLEGAGLLRTGMRWEVRARLANSPETRGAGPEVSFQFEIVDLQAGQFTVRVTRAGSDGRARVVYDRQWRLLYAEGAQDVGAGLDLFPLSVPAFPAFFDDQVRVAGSTFEYAGEDALARQVEVRWKKGDPWPLSMKGVSGEATLVKVER